MARSIPHLTEFASSGARLIPRASPTSSQETSLADAAERTTRGDRAAFARIVTATAPQLFRVAARITGDEDEAEDVLQEAYVKAHDALVGGRFDWRAGVGTWLYRIVANASLDALRNQRRARVQSEASLEEENLTPLDDEGRLAARSALRELNAWLGDLPADQRTALILKELEGLSSAAVAEMMGCSEGAVEQRLVRARAALRRRNEE